MSKTDHGAARWLADRIAELEAENAALRAELAMLKATAEFVQGELPAALKKMHAAGPPDLQPLHRSLKAEPPFAHGLKLADADFIRSVT